MMSLSRRRAQAKAVELLERYHITSPGELAIEDLAFALGARVERGPLDGAMARMVGSANGRAVILVSDKPCPDGAERFSVAHELGHWVLGHGAPCASSDDNPESDADGFAAELLMPSRLLRRWCEVSPVTFEPARRIAEECRVSLVAAGLRFVDLTSERCALIMARRGRIVWARQSKAFVPNVQRGRALDRRSVVVDYFTKGRVYEGCQAVPAEAWLDMNGIDDAEIMEEAVPLPELDAALALLWIPESSARPFDYELPLGRVTSQWLESSDDRALQARLAELRAGSRKAAHP
jgi:hypothetical protein